MLKSKIRVYRFVLRVLIILCALLGLSIEFIFSTGTIIQRMQIFSYYTIQTNLFAGVGIGYILLADLYPAIYSRKYVEIISLSLTVWIFVTFAGYHFLLSNIWFPSGIRGVANILLHYATPGLLILHYFTGKKVLFKGAFFFVLYPFLYISFSQIRGQVSGFYPYWFLSPLPPPEGAGSMRNVLFFIVICAFVYLLLGNLIFVIKQEKLKDKNLLIESANAFLSQNKLKVAIFWFSGTGNTAWVANNICNVFELRGYDCQNYNIERLDLAKNGPIIKEADICGFGYPIYGSDLPVPMKDFILKLNNNEGKKSFVFCTQWLWSGDGAAEGRRYLQTKGFFCLWGEHFLMPNNVCITQSNILPFTNDPAKISRYLKRNQQKCYRFASIIMNGEKFFRGSNYLAYLSGYYLQRMFFKKNFYRFQNDIGFSDDRCTKCAKCVKMCPVNNLKKDIKTGRMLTSGNCILCLRCYNFCSESAITYRGKPFNLNRGSPYRGPTGYLLEERNNENTHDRRNRPDRL